MNGRTKRERELEAWRDVEHRIEIREIVINDTPELMRLRFFRERWGALRINLAHRVAQLVPAWLDDAIELADRYNRASIRWAAATRRYLDAREATRKEAGGAELETLRHLRCTCGARFCVTRATVPGCAYCTGSGHGTCCPAEGERCRRCGGR